MASCVLRNYSVLAHSLFSVMIAERYVTLIYHFIRVVLFVINLFWIFLPVFFFW